MIRSPAVRRRLALGVMVVAGLASLATSQPAYLLRFSVEGVADIGVDGGQIVGTFRLNGDATRAGDLSAYADSLGIFLATRAFEFVPTLGFEPTDPQGGWPLVNRSACERGAPCDIPFTIELRPIGAVRGPVSLPWRMSLLLSPSGDPLSETLEPAVTVNHGSDAPGVASIALLGASVGVLMAAALGLFVQRLIGRARASRVLVGALAASTGGLAAVPLHGALAQGLTPLPGIALALAAAALGLWTVIPSLLARAPGVVVGLGLLTPLVLADLTRQGHYRAIDVGAVAAAAITVATIGALVLAARTDRRQFVARHDLTDRSKLGLYAAVVVTVLILAWAIAVAAGATRFPAIYSAIPTVMVALLVWAIWRWLTGRTLLFVLVAIALMVVTPLGFLAAVFTSPFDPVPEGGLAAASLLAILAAGLVMLIGGRPRRDDSAVWRGWPAPADQSR